MSLHCRRKERLHLIVGLEHPSLYGVVYWRTNDTVVKIWLVKCTCSTCTCLKCTCLNCTFVATVEDSHNVTEALPHACGVPVRRSNGYLLGSRKLPLYCIFILSIPFFAKSYACRDVVILGVEFSLPYLAGRNTLTASPLKHKDREG